MARMVRMWTTSLPWQFGFALMLLWSFWTAPTNGQIPAITGGIPSPIGGIPSPIGGMPSPAGNFAGSRPTCPTPYTSSGWSIRPGYIGNTPNRCAVTPKVPCAPIPYYYVGGYGYGYSAPAQPSTVIVQPAAPPVSTLLPMEHGQSVREFLYVPSASGNGRVGIETIGSSTVSSPTFALTSTTAPKPVEPPPISDAILNRLSSDPTSKDLLALATHADPRVQSRAKQALAAQGEAAVGPLMDALTSDRASLSSAAGDVLAELGPMSVPQLLELLQPEQPLAVRIKAAHTLGKLGGHAEAAAPIMTKMLERETNRDLRFYLLTALAKINQ